MRGNKNGKWHPWFEIPYEVPDLNQTNLAYVIAFFSKITGSRLKMGFYDNFGNTPLSQGSQKIPVIKVQGPKKPHIYLIKQRASNHFEL